MREAAACILRKTCKKIIPLSQCPRFWAQWGVCLPNHLSRISIGQKAGRWWSPGQGGQSDHEEHTEADSGFTEQEFKCSHRRHLKFLNITRVMPSHGINSSPILRPYSKQIKIKPPALIFPQNCWCSEGIFCKSWTGKRHIAGTNIVGSWERGCFCPRPKLQGLSS